MEWASDILHTIVLEGLAVLEITDTIHTVITLMVIVHTAHTTVLAEGMDTTLMATDWADLDGEVMDMDMEMVGTETETDGMVMEAGEARMEMVKRQALHTIIVDPLLLEQEILRPTDVAFFRKI